jgi:hypothetical protein
MLPKIYISALLFTYMVVVPGQQPSPYQNDLRYLEQTVHSKYSNLFYNISAADWDKAAGEFYNQIPDLDKYKVLAGFMRLVALFHVGHTLVNTYPCMEALTICN